MRPLALLAILGLSGSAIADRRADVERQYVRDLKKQPTEAEITSGKRPARLVRVETEAYKAADAVTRALIGVITMPPDATASQTVAALNAFRDALVAFKADAAAPTEHGSR